MKRLIIKALITAIILSILNVIISAFEPVVSSNLAVQQLNDSYESNAMLTIYENLKPYVWICEVVIVALVLQKDIRNVFNKK